MARFWLMSARMRVPQVVDRYHLVAPIGKGGMAEVFRARLSRIGGFEREVAIKLLLPEFSSEPEFVEMLLDEARIAGAINHPCVVQTLDVGRQDAHFYIVMELVDGRDLRSILRTATGVLPLPAALYIVGELLRGLGAVHGATDGGGVSRKIVHRDVSPANVLIDKLGAVKLGDFGIAHASSRLTRTRNGAVKGKLRYMAPEQLSGAPVDHRADLYAAGVMLCELLCGSEACEPRRQTPYGAVFAWSPQLGQRLPADVRHLAARALAEDPTARFPDAAAFRRALAVALHKRHPGYGADELARDLQVLDECFLNDAPTIASRPIDLRDKDVGLDLTSPSEATPAVRVEAGEREQPSTEPHPLLPAEALARVAAPLPRLSPPAIALPFHPPLPSHAIRLRRSILQLDKRVYAAGAATLAALAVAALLSTGASSAAVTPPPPRAPIATPLFVPRAAATGTLTVGGPPGTQVAIGAVAYPPAPCAFELPPGEYEVKLRRRTRARTRHVTIAPGAVTPIKL